MKHFRKRLLTLVTVFAAAALCFVTLALPAFASEAPPLMKTVVSIGDSYASGEGIEPFFGQYDSNGNAVADSVKVLDQNWLAHRSTNAWSGKLRINGSLLSDYHDTKWYFAAASGADTTHLKTKQVVEFQLENQENAITTELDKQIDVFRKVNGSVDYVTLSIGGNDVGFVEILTNALNDKDTFSAYIADKLSDASMAPVLAKIKQYYLDVAEAAGSRAKIIVAGYPYLIGENGYSTMGGFVKVCAENAEVLHDAVDTFNAMLAGIVKECREAGKNIFFAPVAQEFEGHEAGTDDPYINGLIFERQSQDLMPVSLASEKHMTSSYSMHPNEKGATAYAKAVQEVLDALENPVTYIDASGSTVPLYPGDYKTADPSVTSWTAGTYVVADEVTFENRISVSGTVNLVLCDNAKLIAKSGINVPSDATFKIFVQSTGDDMGSLEASGVEYCAAIGGNDKQQSGTVIIYGGNIKAEVGNGNGASCMHAAGIGGGTNADNGTVIINGGNVIAAGYDNGAGIGGGANGDGGTITINGGTVRATGGHAAAGIGGGVNGNGGIITVNGGTVIAAGGSYAAGIGGGCVYVGGGGSGTVKFNGGTVTATGGEDCVSIGPGRGGTERNVDLSGGTFTFWDDTLAGYLSETEAAIKTGDNYTVGEAVPYIGADGEEHNAKLYTVVTGSMTSLGNMETNEWYVVNDDTTINGISINGAPAEGLVVTGMSKVNLILCDGATLSLPSGLKCYATEFNIYGQSRGIGKLNIDKIFDVGASDEGQYAAAEMSWGKTSVYGGIINIFADNEGSQEAAVYGMMLSGTGSDVHKCSFDMHGGKVTIVGNASGIFDDNEDPTNTINIGWTKYSDWILVSDISNGTTENTSLNFTSNFVIQGTTTAATTENISGKTIVPAYKIGFDTVGGFDLDPMYIAVAYSGSATVGASGLPTPERKGSVFVGWSEDSSDIGDTLTLTADTVLKAVWECGDIDYIGADGKPAKVLAGEYEYITDGDNSWGTDSTGTYVVGGDIEITETVTLNRDINLILLDGAKLTIDVDAQNCIYGYDISLSVFGQSSENAGELILKNSNNEGYGIRVYDYSQYGGTVTATSNGDKFNAIYSVNDITITGGEVTSRSISAGNITISGGTVTATSSSYVRSAIYSSNDITITGGTVNATSNGNSFEAIYSSYDITITGGEVTATSNGDDCIAIYSSKDIKISGGTVTATSNGDECIAIYSFNDITITGGTVNATSNGNDCTAIFSLNDIKISGGQTDAGSIMHANGNISLGWTEETDSIYAAGYTAEKGEIVLLNDFILADTEEDASVDNINGKTLIPKPNGVRVAKVTAPGAKQLRFEGVFTLPEDAEKLTYAALIATTKDSIGENLTYENCSYLKGKSNPTAFNDDGEFLLTWTRSSVTAAQTWYVRPYIKYTMNGKTYKEYGKIVKIKLVNGEAVKLPLDKQVYTVTVTGNGYIGEKGIQTTAVEEGKSVDVAVAAEYFESEEDEIKYVLRYITDENGDQVEYEDSDSTEDMVIFKVRPTGNLTVTPVYKTSYKVTALGSTFYIEPGKNFSLTVPDEISCFKGWSVNGKLIKYDGSAGENSEHNVIITEPTKVELVYGSSEMSKVTVIGGIVLGYELDEDNSVSVPKGTKLTILPAYPHDNYDAGWSEQKSLSKYGSNVCTFTAENEEYKFEPCFGGGYYGGFISDIRADDSGITFSAKFTDYFGNYCPKTNIKYAGIIATTKDSVGYDLSYENCSYIKGKSNPVCNDEHEFTLNWIKKGIKEGQTWYVRTYYKCELEGYIYKLYGEVIAVQLIDGELVCVNPPAEVSEADMN